MVSLFGNYLSKLQINVFTETSVFWPVAFSAVDIRLMGVSITGAQHPNLITEADWHPCYKHLRSMMPIIWHHGFINAQFVVEDAVLE